jgi:hypothetical protein
MLAFEQDVRNLLKAALRCCPHEESKRKTWLKSLYEISDQAKADSLEINFKSIRDDNIRNQLLSKLQAF